MDTVARRRLETSGFGIQTIGFEGSEIPLYAHKATAIAARGEIQMRLHVANPPNLNEGETATLERKAAAGFFQWKPGQDCLQRTFKDLQVIRDPDTDASRIETSGVYRGCKWCRAELQHGSQGGGVEQGSGTEGSENESSFSSADASSPVPLEAVFSRPGPSDGRVDSNGVRSELAVTTCPSCDFVPKTHSRSGKPRSPGQLKQALDMHRRAKHGV